MQLQRTFPIRFTATVLTLAFLGLEGILRHYDCGVSDEVLLAAIALVGGGVAGDTGRPSGAMKLAGQKITPEAA